MDELNRVSNATLTSDDDGIQVSSGPLFVPPALDIVEPTPPTSTNHGGGAAGGALAEILPPHEGGVSPTERDDDEGNRSQSHSHHGSPMQLPPQQHFIHGGGGGGQDCTPPGPQTPASARASTGPSSYDSDGRVLANHAQMVVDLDDYSQQAQRYFSLGNYQPQWGTSGSQQQPVLGSPSSPNGLVVGGGHGLYSAHHGRTTSSSNNSSSGGAAAGAVMRTHTPTQQTRDRDAAVTPTHFNSATHMPPSQTSNEDNTEVGSTASTEDELMMRYKAERLERIMNNSGRDSMGGFGDSESGFGGAGGGGGGRRSTSMGGASSRRSVGGTAGGGGGGGPQWTGGMSTEMAENLRKLEQFAASLDKNSPSRGRHAADEAVRIAPLDRARIVRVLRCKKTLQSAKKACVKLSALVDRLGLSLMTYDDVAAVLATKCIAVPEGVRTGPDDSNILYLQAGRIPLVGDANMDATQIARAAIFLIESHYTASENWSLIIDSAGMTPQKWQNFSSTLTLLKEFLVDSYPVRVKHIYVYRLPRGSGASSLAAGVLLTALEVRYIPSKVRKRIKYINKLGGVVDESQLVAALRVAGVEPAW